MIVNTFSNSLIILTLRLIHFFTDLLEFFSTNLIVLNQRIQYCYYFCMIKKVKTYTIGFFQSVFPKHQSHLFVHKSKANDIPLVLVAINEISLILWQTIILYSIALRKYRRSVSFANSIFIATRLKQIYNIIIDNSCQHIPKYRMVSRSKALVLNSFDYRFITKYN